MMAKIGVVEAVGTAVVSKDKGQANKLQKAMSDAIAKAYKDGITDPDQIKALMRAAYNQAKQ